MYLRNRASFVLLLLSLTAAAFGQQTSYTLVDLGVIDKWWSQAAAINNQGQVTGFSSTAPVGGWDPFQGPQHAFLWSAKDGMRDLGVLQPFGFYSFGNAINDRGQVAGISVDFPWYARERAIVASRQDGMIDLGLLPGGYSSAAFGINNAGIVTGRADTTIDFFGYLFNQTHAFRYTSNGGMADLGSLIAKFIASMNLDIDDFGYSTASAINQRGQIVGRSDFLDSDFNYFQHAFRFTEGVGMVDLGVLPGFAYSEARAINNQGSVVGYVSYPIPFDYSNFAPAPFLYSDARGMEPLPTPLGLTFFPNGINDAGVVVGQSDPSTPFGADPGRAIIYTPGHGAWDLNLLITNLGGWVVYSATGINNCGEIVGFAARDPNEFFVHAVMLVPVTDK